MLVTAAAAAMLVWPAASRLGDFNGWWLAAAILGLPVLVLLAVTGAPYYGAIRATVCAAVIAVVTCIVGLVVAVFTFATALSGSVAGIVLALLLSGAPRSR